MRWPRWIPWLALLVPLVWIGLAGGGRDPAPCRFTGSARLRLAPASPGTVIAAWVDDEKVAETTVGADSRYALSVPGRYGGRTVVFRFPAHPELSRAGLAGCEAGREQVVDLDADAHQGCGGA